MLCGEIVGETPCNTGSVCVPSELVFMLLQVRGVNLGLTGVAGPRAPVWDDQRQSGKNRGAGD